MQRKKLIIGLYGFGCVGAGLYEVLQKTPGFGAEIRKICVKQRNKVRSLDATYFTYDPEEILADPEINTVVELIDDADAAYHIVKSSLKQGKAVVTANKKMVAEHFEELYQLQQEYGVQLLYEAACCASLPIIRNLEEYYDNDLLESVEGIVNGSTNYILTKTVEDQISYTEALAIAQEMGFAESDPTLDTQGYDAKYKLLLLLAHAFGVSARPDEIFNLGIDRLGETEFNYAREKGYRIKLVASAEKGIDGKIKAFVMPKFISSEDRLYAVDDEFNGIKTRSYFSDVQFFMGRGAGAFPTASAVLSDISALSYDYRYEYKKKYQNDSLAAAEDIYLRVYVSHKADAEIRPYFTEINETYQNHSSGFTIGIIDLSSLINLSRDTELNTSIVLFDVVSNEIVEFDSAVPLQYKMTLSA